MRFASVILPLALPGTFTYEIPDEFSSSAQCGMRVLVNFGKKKIYTGIIVGIDEQEVSDTCAAERLGSERADAADPEDGDPSFREHCKAVLAQEKFCP